MLSQKGELLLPGGVTQTEIPVQVLLLWSLYQLPHEEVYERGLWDQNGGADKCVRKRI